MILNKNRMSSFFWLHIKKCGGESFRATFSPPYIQTNRIDPKPFISIPKEEWNDALNSFKIPLGEYDYKRMLFAKEFLYSTKEFSRMFKFTIIRNPYARAVSAWRYLSKHSYYLNNVRKDQTFVDFLKELPFHWENKIDRHISTHTAPFWNDITDTHDNILIDRAYKLENIETDIQYINQKLKTKFIFYKHVNINQKVPNYRVEYDDESKRLVESYYKHDIEYFNYKF